MKILLVEDEDRIADFIVRGLSVEGYRVERVADGEQGLARAAQPEFSLVILDLRLPKLTGEQVLERLRAQGCMVPVLVLSAKDGVDDRVRNLNSGADDYVTKPFSFAELLARIQARLRTQEQMSSSTLEYGRVSLDMRTRRARIDGRDVDLTTREYSLLDTLLRHPDQVLSHTQLLDLVWGYDFDGGSNVVEVYIRHLRRKLAPELIETVRGAGYRLCG